MERIVRSGARDAGRATDPAQAPADDQIDQICDQFEAELKAGRRPDLSQILDRVPVELRESLLVELVLVGLEYTGTSAHRQNPTDTTRPDRITFQLATTSESGENVQPGHTTDSTPGLAGDLGSFTPRRIIGGYELLDELGRGGMGVVYRARQISAERIVALKIIQGSQFEGSDHSRRAILIERFRTEIKAASRVDHENIATVYEVGQFGDAPYFAMRFVDGISLGKLVQRSPLPPRHAVRYLLPISQSIAKLHLAGVVHRDLKPSNILIEKASDTPVLTDFGLAKLADAQKNVTLSDEGFGSPPYMAPEQVLHATSVTGAADIYSLGATLYHLLTGRPPFQADSLPEVARQIVFCNPIPPRQIEPSIDRDLETICLKCLEKDEHRRYATAGDLASELQRFLDNRPIVARPVGRLGSIWRWSRRNPLWVILAISVMVLLSACATTFTLMYSRERRAIAVAQGALEASRLDLSNKLFDKSRFAAGADPHEVLPWLIACLKLDARTSRESLTRRRIHSALHHGSELSWIYCHDGPISCAEFSPDGDCVLTGSSDRTARVWSTQTGRCLAVFPHEAPVRQVAFSHRGDLAATAADNGNVQLWSLETGEKHGRVLAHPGYVTFAAFAADDSLLVTASADERVRVWRTKGGSLQTSIVADSVAMPISCLAISPDGSRGVSCCGTSIARLWSISNGEFSPFELEHSATITSAQFSPDAAAIVTGSADGNVRVWESKTGGLILEFTLSGAVKQVCFTPDSQRVVALTDEAASVWPIGPSEHGAIALLHSGLNAVAIDPTSVLAVTVGDDRTARIWNLQDGKSLGTPLFHAENITGARFSADGTSVLTFSADGTARVWNCPNILKKSRIAEVRPIAMVDFTVDQQWILAWSQTGVLNTFRANKPEVGQTVVKHDQSISAACISPDGARVAAADTEGRVIVWDRESGRELMRKPFPGQAFTAICLGPRGEWVAAGDTAGNIAVSSVQDSGALKSFRLPKGVVQVAFSTNGNLLLAADSKTARLIRLDFQDAQTEPVELGGDILGACFSPDGTFVAVYGAANRALIWNTAAGSLKVLRAGSQVNEVRFSRNSSKLLTAARDGTVQIWRVVDGSLAHVSLKDARPVLKAAFSPDGQSVALCIDDNSVRIWQLETGRPVTVPLRHARRIAHLQFLSPRQLLTMTEYGDVDIIDASPIQTSIEELEVMSMALCGCYVDPAGHLVRLTRPELLRRCRDLNHRAGRSPIHSQSDGGLPY